ncbi:DEAD/DEAH box helicase [Planctomycetales bacterium ZRK34]|nr:DEAD/DEAH box helicase [Planctomycetales bacterium ZRK34]
MPETDDLNSGLTPDLVACLEEWGIKSLTDIQKRAVARGVPTGTSAVICAPTSSGKTLVGELALANAMTSDLNALYLVSHKALAEQKYADFSDRFSSPRWQGTATVGISTGDHEEGDVNCRLLVSTYEKALGLVLAGRLKVPKTLVIADELQLMGEDGRGAEVETLCSLLRQRQPHQFVGLTATVENPEELAAWMGCETVHSTTRDVELIQTILWNEQQHSVRFGQEDGETKNSTFGTADLNGVVRKLLQDGLGPVLVFTETRREASELAGQFSERCQRSSDGLIICKQLELFSEPTESSQQLMAHAERRVTFHTADLTPDERTVIEAGFSTSSFDVCFATSTLAAGVNFPFRTVVISKLTYSYGDREGKLFSRSDYRNMSGRAGRLGYHEDGRAILLPRNAAELKHANMLVLPENDDVRSKMVALSMRRTVLSLVAARAISSRDELTAFFKNTFYWHQASEHNPKLLDVILDKAHKAIEWLLSMKFLEESYGTIQTTPLGKSTAMSGLLPETAKQFVDLLAAKTDSLINEFVKYEIGLIHWALTCPEFMGEKPDRFLPWPAGRMKPESSVFMRSTPLLTAWDRSDEKVTRCTHALGLFIHGEAERKIRFFTGVSAGHLHRLATDLSAIIDGLRCVSGAVDIGCPQVLTNNIGMLSRRVRWGTPIEAIDVLRIASQKKVPGFGRQRVMALLANGLETVIDVIAAGKDRLVKLLGGQERADSLVAALSDSVTAAAVRYDRVHQQLGQEIGVEEKVAKCNNSLGTEYEDAIYDLLKEELNWTVEQVDDGKRQNVPDILLELGAISLLIECKTVTKKPPLITKEDAFAVLQKAADYDGAIRRVTLGKPDFDEHSKKKAAASAAITLVQHHVFMEGLMRVLTGRMTAQGFVEWLAEPGVTDLSRLPGTPTYVEAEQ